MDAGAARAGAPRGQREVGRAPPRGGQAPRPHAGREALRPGLVRRARPLRPPPRSELRDDGSPPLRRRGRHRLWDDLRPARLRLLPGLHRLRRLAQRGLRREDLQGHGPGGQVRLPGDRDQRLGRCADPGGRRLARRLRGDLLAQRAGVGRDPADLPRDGPLRRRRCLLAGDDGLHLHGRGLVVHVHHRPRRREDRDRGGGDVRGARRRGRARDEVGGRAVHRARRGDVPRGRALPPLVPAAEQCGTAGVERADRSGRPRGRGARLARSRQPEQALRHARRDPARRRRRRASRGERALGGEHRHGVRAARRPSRRRGRQPAALARGRARHRRLQQGGAFRPYVRRLQRSRSSRSSTFRASCLGRSRSGAGSSATARSSSTRTARRRCRS